MKRTALALLIGLIATPSFAKDMHPIISLQDIQSLKTTEKKGDEIYVNVTEYLPNGKTSTNNIPVLPLAWKSQDLSKLKNLKLWEGDLTEGQSADVIITFVEQDHPPFDPDDLVGIVQLKMVNQKGQLQTTWNVREGVADGKLQELVDNLQPEFKLTGSKGEYQVKLKLDN